MYSYICPLRYFFHCCNIHPLFSIHFHSEITPSLDLGCWGLLLSLHNVVTSVSLIKMMGYNNLQLSVPLWPPCVSMCVCVWGMDVRTCRFSGHVHTEAIIKSEGKDYGLHLGKSISNNLRMIPHHHRSPSQSVFPLRFREAGKCLVIMMRMLKALPCLSIFLWNNYDMPRIPPVMIL